MDNNPFVTDDSADIDNITLLTDNDTNIPPPLRQNSLLGETIGCGILDSACVKTVSGEEWINIYLESLSVQERKLVTSTPASGKFRFGDGPVIYSNRILNLPVHIGKTKATLAVHVVPYNVPLLISRHSLTMAQAQLNFETHSITMFGEQIPLIVTSSGHHCINQPITLI